MKVNYLVLIGFICIVFMAIFFTWGIEVMKERNLKQKEIDGLKRTNEKQRDSLELILKLKNDSLNIAFETIRTASAEREEAHKRSQATIRNLQKIIFVQHSDSSRTSTLKELYKSYK